MTAPASREEWADAFEALAEWREGRRVDQFAHALGIDPQPLIEYATADAMETFAENVLPDWMETGKASPESVIAACAASLHMGVEMGLWLAQTGRVS